MSAQTIVVDPVTRIEGHLRIEAEYDGSVITRASSSGTMVRGIEIILRGRDPRDAWAFAQRICGVCTLVHGIASVRAVEDALKITIPANAQLIRNLMIGAQFVHDHVMHFYHLHALDWVDVVSALKADPKATSALAQSISTYARSSPGYFADVQNRVKKLVESGQLGIFANAYWGTSALQAAAGSQPHGGGALSGRARLAAPGGAAAHHLRRQEPASELPRRRRPVRHQRASAAREPGTTAVNAVGLQKVAQIIEQMRSFVDEVYVPDTLAIASFYKDWFKTGEGVGNFMTYGDFPATGSPDLDAPGAARRDSGSRPVAHRGERRSQRRRGHPGIRGAFLVRLQRRQGCRPASLQGRDQIELLGATAAVSATSIPRRAIPGSSRRAGRATPWRWGRWRACSCCTPAVTSRRRSSPHKALDATGSAARSHVFHHGAHRRAHARVQDLRRRDAAVVRQPDGEHQSRRRAHLQRDSVGTFDLAAAMRRAWDSPRRRAVPWRHWIVIDDGRISNYQAVVPSTWNAGPRDAAGIEGPYEAALKGQSVQDPKQPLEILRTIHSFDPCLACAVHVVDPDGEELIQVRVQ